MALKGYHVEVYANPSIKDINKTIYYPVHQHQHNNNNEYMSQGSVTWYHYSYYNVDRTSLASLSPYECEDVFIAWRYSVSLPLSQAPIRYLWLHDLVTADVFPTSLANQVRYRLHYSNYSIILSNLIYMYIDRGCVSSKSVPYQRIKTSF